MKVEIISRSISYQEELIESLKDPLEAAPYIEACLEEENSEVLKLALNDVVEARHRIGKTGRTIVGKTRIRNLLFECFTGCTGFSTDGDC
jgi:hypothetical protein